MLAALLVGTIGVVVLSSVSLKIERKVVTTTADEAPTCDEQRRVLLDYLLGVEGNEPLLRWETDPVPVRFNSTQQFQDTFSRFVQDSQHDIYSIEAFPEAQTSEGVWTGVLIVETSDISEWVPDSFLRDQLDAATVASLVDYAKNVDSAYITFKRYRSIGDDTADMLIFLIVLDPAKSRALYDDLDVFYEFVWQQAQIPTVSNSDRQGRLTSGEIDLYIDAISGSRSKADVVTAIEGACA